MATVIDSLVVTLGLDPSNFTKGQKEAASAFLKTKEEATKGAKAIEESSKKAADAIHKIAVEALAMFAIFTGSRGLKDFVSDMVSADAALGRFGKSLNDSPQIIAAWGNAAERVGGSADATAASFGKIADALNDLHVNGRALPNAYYRLMADSRVNIDTEHGPAKFLSDVAVAVNKLAQTDPSKAAFYAKGMGIDQGTVNLMIQYGGAINQYIGGIQKLSPTPAQIKAAQDLQEAWARLQQTFSSLGNSILPALNNALGPVLTGMGEWIDKNRDLINSKVQEVAQKLADALRSITWSDITSGMQSFAQLASQAAAATIALVNALGELAAFNERSKGWAITKLLEGGPGGGNTPQNSTPYLSGNVTVRKGSIADTIMGWFGGGSVDGHRAAGGPASRGRSYMVGEYGPERFTPSEGGTVTPNNGLGGGDTQVDGRPVTKTNPMPVMLTEGNGNGSGENWLQTLGKGISTLFGGGGTSGGGGGASGGSKNSVGGENLGTYSGPTGGAATGNAKRLMDFLVTKRGWTPAAAAVAAANANAESSFNPKAWGDKSLSNAGHGVLPGTEYGSYGLFQWNRGRLAALQKFGGANWKDFNVQAEFFAREAERMLPHWKGQKDLSQASALGKSFEGYRGPIQPARAAHAASYLRGYSAPINVGAGARTSAGMVGTSNDNRKSSTTNVNGPITIHTQATDGKGVAAALNDALRRTTQASTANYGLK